MWTGFTQLNSEISADKSNLAAHKGSADHDGRYYTESEINTKLASYVLKSMMSGTQVNDANKVPTSALVYALNNNTFKKATHYRFAEVDLGAQTTVYATNASKQCFYNRLTGLLKLSFQGTVTIKANTPYKVITLPFKADYSSQNAAYVLSEEPASVKVSVDGNLKDVYLFSSKALTNVTVGFEMYVTTQPS